MKIRLKYKSTLDEIGKIEINVHKILDVEYEIPFIHHVTMEPMNWEAQLTDNSCDL